MKYDVAIIGAGVCGAAIARTLSAYKLKVVLLEKEVDVSFGTSKANSGIIHGGFHHNKKHLKTQLEVEGNLMFDRLQRELDFPFDRCGILTVAFKEEELKILNNLYTQGVENGAIGIEMCSRDRILDLEPKLSSDVIGGLYAPNGGIIEPYRFVFALVESAKKNGVNLIRDFEVKEAVWNEDCYQIKSSNGEEIEARFIVNAAGLFADDVSKIFKAEEFTINPRKGQYFLLDRQTKAKPNKVLFPVPTPVSKGMLVIPTVEGTVLIGPTADEVDSKYDLDTTADKMEEIFDSARKMIPSVSERDVITSFSGLRPAIDSKDFLIEISKKAKNFIQAAGIQSPGLTASPAIAIFVKNLLNKAGLELTEKSDFDPYLTKTKRVRDLDHYTVDKLIKENPAYGNMICRCEKVSEAEIIEAIKQGHTTIDGVKFFTRAGMGRCQGGFCNYKTIKIIMRETGLSYDEVTKKGKDSKIIISKL